MRKIILLLVFLWTNISFSQTDTTKAEYGITSFYAKKFEGRNAVVVKYSETIV
jgi:hypothetical protein